MALTLRPLKRAPIIQGATRMGVSGNFTIWRDSAGKEYAKRDGSGQWFRVVPKPENSHRE